MPSIEFNRYYKYDELTKLLSSFQSEYPNLVQVFSIGKSYEGREIWLVTVTDFSTGQARNKPAFWADGNIHASELSASTAVLMILHKLVNGFQTGDKNIQEILSKRAFYLVPRLNPDGAEWAMEEPARVIRSSTRPYPFEEKDCYGIERKDIDGNGKILNMRVKDSNGPWKIAEENPRLLKKREPGESGGTYYRVLPEGLFHNFDEMSLRTHKVQQGLDLNRNFPSAWRIESEQHGAGPFPTSEPEVHSIVKAISERPNICGAISFHTFSGVLLRPPSRMPDDDLPPEDIWTYKALGEVGFKMTGYPAISNFHEFRYHPKEVITGVFDDWMYEHRGVHAWTVEIWSPQRQAGIKDYKYIDWFREHPFEDDIKLLEWSDKALEGKGYYDWVPFEHPQLGSVEIGGWDAKYAFGNPPPKFLEAEVAPIADWAIWHANTGPCLEQREIRIEKAGEGVHKIRFAVQNTGWLATNVTKIGADKKLCRGVVGEVFKQGESHDSLGTTTPNWLVSGQIRQTKGQLRGWSEVPTSGFGWHSDETTDAEIFEWVIQGPGEFVVEARHERAGLVRAKFALP